MHVLKVSAKIKEVTKCEGEATANNRKAKLIFFYEWTISGDWEGSLKANDNKTIYKGTFDINNLSEEYEVKDVHVIFVSSIRKFEYFFKKNFSFSVNLKKISFSFKDKSNDSLKDFLRKELDKSIKDQLSRYLILLREGTNFK